MASLTPEFLQKVNLLSKEKQQEIIRLVDFALEEGIALRKEYGIKEPELVELAGKTA